jgi:hypothetical protein
VFKEDISLNEIKDIINEIVFTYDMESTLQAWNKQHIIIKPQTSSQVFVNIVKGS